MKQSIAHFIHLQKLKQLLMTGLSVMDLNQSILRLHQTYKNLLERFQIGFSSLSIYYYFKMLKDFKTLNWKQLYQTVERTKPSKKKKCLINIQNINDNECFEWCLVRHVQSCRS